MVSYDSGFKFLLIASPLLVSLTAGVPFIHHFDLKHLDFPTHGSQLSASLITLIGVYLISLRFFLRE